VPDDGARVGALVQARLSSTRLPGKVLRPLAGRPLIDWLLERLGHAGGLDVVGVATSDDASDDALAAHLQEAGVPCARGPLDDVAARMVEAAQELGLDAFARVNADSPLLDPALVTRAVAAWRAGGSDLVTNVHPVRTCPKGQSVEVVRVDALRRALPAFDADEREHVTLGLYRRPGGLTIESLTCEPPTRDVALTVDDAADAEALSGVLERLERPHCEYGWRELADLRRAARS
jgi:spore coat polysaccharide biosynthesis protein SpsF